jgi:hypothetical protein
VGNFTFAPFLLNGWSPAILLFLKSSVSLPSHGKKLQEPLDKNYKAREERVEGAKNTAF